MKDNFLELIDQEYCVLDGGFGTILQERGLTTEDLPEEWNIKRPDVIREIHLEYFNAGAQIVTTNTFGGSPLKMGMKEKQYLVEDVNRRAVMLAKEALELFRDNTDIPEEKRQEQRFIAGSIGPSGKILGMEISEGQASNSCLAQARVLAEAGVHLFIIETMMDLNEAEIYLKTLKRELDLPVIASLVFNRVKGGFKTLFGNSVSESVQRLIGAGADVVGTNCGLIEDYVEVIKEMRALTDRPLVMYPNAGIPKLVDGQTRFEQSPEYMIGFLERSIRAGATIIGGCCGTTPAYIQKIAKRIKHRKRTA